MRFRVQDSISTLPGNGIGAVLIQSDNMSVA